MTRQVRGDTSVNSHSLNLKSFVIAVRKPVGENKGLDNEEMKSIPGSDTENVESMD